MFTYVTTPQKVQFPNRQTKVKSYFMFDDDAGAITTDNKVFFWGAINSARYIVLKSDNTCCKIPPQMNTDLEYYGDYSFDQAQYYMGYGFDRPYEYPIHLFVPADAGDPVEISYGHASTQCVTYSTGRIWCWGANVYTKVNGNIFYPEEVPLPSGYLKFQQGKYGACYITATNKFFCRGRPRYAVPFWDESTYDESTFKYSTEKSEFTEVTLPTGVTGVRDFYFMGGCRNYNCLIGNNDKIYCWGHPFQTVSYTDYTVDNFYTEITGLPSNVKPLKIKISDAYWACVECDDGNIYCFKGSLYTYMTGSQDDDDFTSKMIQGDGTTNLMSLFITTPVLKPSGLSTIKEWNIGGQRFCMIMEDDVMYCFGPDHVYGDCGDNVACTELSLAENTGVYDIALYTNCNGAGPRTYNWVLSPTDTTQRKNAWVDGTFYEREFSLSTGFCTDASQGTEADCVGSVEGMAKTDEGRLCLIDGYKKLHCKETGNWKEIAISGVVQVSTGASTTCAVTENGKLYCFGPTLEDAPQEVTLPEGTAKHVEVSGNGQCATNNNNKLFCWGDQEFSNLGVGSTVGTSVASPLPVGNPAGLDTFTVDKFKVSDFSACAITNATQLALNCQFGKTSHIIPDNSTWPEYDCSNPATSGTYKLTTSCTLSAEVALTGDLTIVGQTQDMDNLVTITAAASSRHFKLDSTNDVLNLLHVHLTRGRGSGHGGSIELYGSAKLNLYYSVISNSVSGQRGGVIYASSAVINIFGCSIRDNQAGWNGGGLNVAHTTLVIINTNFHNNKAGNLWTGGAITISSSSLVIRNSIISGSRAEDGAGIRAQGSGITISESTFTNNVNLGGYAAHDIKLVQASVTLVNTVLDRGNNGGWYQGYISTCSHNPCVHAPYTGACSAVDASNSKKGVTCALATDYEFSVETCGTCSTPSLTSKTTCDTTATWIPYSVATTWTEDYGGKMFCWGKAPFNGLSSDVDVPTKLSLPAGTSGSEQKMLDFDMGISFGSTIPASTASTTASSTASSDIYVSAGQLSVPYYTFTDSDGNAVTALEANTIYTFHRLNGATTHPFAIDHSGAQYSTGSVTNGITGSATITVDTTNVNELVVQMHITPNYGRATVCAHIIECRN